MFANLGLVLLLLLAGSLVPKFPLVSYINFTPEGFSDINDHTRDIPFREILIYAYYSIIALVHMQLNIAVS